MGKDENANKTSNLFNFFPRHKFLEFIKIIENPGHVSFPGGISGDMPNLQMLMSFCRRLVDPDFFRT